MTLYQKTFRAIALVSCIASYSSEGNALKGMEWSKNFDDSQRAYRVCKLPSAKKHHHRIASVFGSYYALNDEAAKPTKAATPEKALKFEHVRRNKKLSPEARKIVTKRIHERKPTGLGEFNMQGLRKAVAWRETGEIQGAETERKPMSLRLISRD